MSLNYSDIKFFDTANGPGVRVSLFVSGCTLHCPGCFNRVAQNFKHGNPFTSEVFERLIQALEVEGVEGLSILGGDPFEPKHFIEVARICALVKERLPGKSIWVWTGRTLDEVLIIQSRLIVDALKNVDVLVDGRFVQSLADPNLSYRGSSNQRVLMKNAKNCWVPLAEAEQTDVTM